MVCLFPFSQYDLVIGDDILNGHYTLNGINANVAESQAEGAEITVIGQLTERFRFDIGVGILDTKYISIQDDVTGVTLDDKFGTENLTR